MYCFGTNVCLGSFVPFGHVWAHVRDTIISPGCCCALRVPPNAALLGSQSGGMMCIGAALQDDKPATLGTMQPEEMYCTQRHTR